MLEVLASPFNCIYSAAKLKQNPKYPETEIMGSGRLHLRRARGGTELGGQALRRLFRAGPALLDGYKAFFVKSSAAGARHHRRPVRRRVPRPQPRRATSCWTR